MNRMTAQESIEPLATSHKDNHKSSTMMFSFKCKQNIIYHLFKTPICQRYFPGGFKLLRRQQHCQLTIWKAAGVQSSFLGNAVSQICWDFSTSTNVLHKKITLWNLSIYAMSLMQSKKASNREGGGLSVKETFRGLRHCCKKVSYINLL